MAEATQWLEAAGFIIQAPEQSTSYKTLTRRGRRLASAEAYAEYRKASLLPRNLLHPSITPIVWSTFLRGDYDAAVFQAFKAVEVAVREVSNSTNRDNGVSIIRSAFHPDT